MTEAPAGGTFAVLHPSKQFLNTLAVLDATGEIRLDNVVKSGDHCGCLVYYPYDRFVVGYHMDDPHAQFFGSESDLLEFIHQCN